MITIMMPSKCNILLISLNWTSFSLSTYCPDLMIKKLVSANTSLQNWVPVLLPQKKDITHFIFVIKICTEQRNKQKPNSSKSYNKRGLLTCFWCCNALSISFKICGSVPMKHIQNDVKEFFLENKSVFETVLRNHK